MEAKLVVVGGRATKSEIRLKLPAVLGRVHDADVIIAHRTVSRHHCVIFEQDAMLVVRDNGSLNGTIIEGHRIQEAVLKPGDRLMIGPLTFEAQYELATLDASQPTTGAGTASSQKAARENTTPENTTPENTAPENTAREKPGDAADLEPMDPEPAMVFEPALNESDLHGNVGSNGSASSLDLDDLAPFGDESEMPVIAPGSDLTPSASLAETIDIQKPAKTPAKERTPAPRKSPDAAPEPAEAVAEDSELDDFFKSIGLD